MLANLHESQVSKAGGKSWSTARAKKKEGGFKKNKNKKANESNEGLQLIKYSPILLKDCQGFIRATLGL